MLGIYIRVSTAVQVERGTSLATQLDECIKKAKERGYDEWKVYADEGFSGVDLDRPGITSLREDIMKGNINSVICLDVDRLARGTIFQLLVLEEIRKKKVDLIFVNSNWQDTPEGRLLFQMQSVIAEYELAKIKLRTTWGRIRSAKNGQVMPMRIAPFGYCYDSQKGLLSINHEEAPYVPMIYQWYVFGQMTLREMGTRLMELGVKSKMGGNWSASSLRRILKSPVYIGKFYYNQRETKIKEDSGRTPLGYKKREYSFRDSKEWIEIKVPALIDEDLYLLAQEQAKKNSTMAKRNTKQNYLLKGLLLCGLCGRRMQATTTVSQSPKSGAKAYPLYRCPGKQPRSFGDVKKCEAPSISARILEERLWGEILKVLDKEFLVKLFNEGIPKETALEQELLALNNTLEQAKIGKEKLLLLYQRNKLSDEEIDRFLDKYNFQFNIIKEQKQKLEVRMERAKNSLDIEKGAELALKVFKMLSENILSFEKRRELIEILVSSIQITPKGETILVEVERLGINVRLDLQRQEV